MRQGGSVGSKVLRGMKVFSCRVIGFNVRRRLCEGVVV